MDITNLPTLNLPKSQLQIRREPTGVARIYDACRGKWVALTPEEWVRQNFVSMLVSQKHYPAGRIANEVSVNLNSMSRRCDTVIYDTSLKPFMIVEYKAPSVALSQRTFDQIVRYNMVLRARYLVVSNGLAHYCCEINYENMSYSFLPDIPAFEG